MGEARDVSDLVRAAASGGDAAWKELVDHFGGLIWTLARAEGLTVHDACDVEQLVWLRLVEHIERVRDPQRLRFWLLTTARNECRRLRAANQRVHPLPEAHEASAGWARGADDEVLERERIRIVLRALRRLPIPCGLLLRLLARDPPPDSATMAAMTGIPHGDLPAVRRRCLRLFRRHLNAPLQPPRNPR